MVLIHLDGANIGEASDERPGLQALWPRAAVLELYCRWAATHAQSVSVLLPERVKSRLSRGLITLGRVSPVWYNGNGVTVPSQICRRGAQVWVINGGQLPLVDWTASTTETVSSKDSIFARCWAFRIRSVSSWLCSMRTET